MTQLLLVATTVDVVTMLTSLLLVSQQYCPDIERLYLLLPSVAATTALL